MPENTFFSLGANLLLINRKAPRKLLRLIYKRWRWLSCIIAGVAVQFLLDLAFGLIYRNYQVFHGIKFFDYLLTISISFLVLEGVRWINKQINKSYTWETRPTKRFLLQSFSNMIFVVLVTIIIRLSAYWFISRGIGLILLTNELVAVTVVSFVMLVTLLLEVGIFLLNRYRLSLAQIERFKKENIEFRFEMLKTQVNPHFLFNSLNTLASLVYSDQDVAARFVRQLSKVYRNVLESRGKVVITIEEEIAFLDSYIYLLKIRFSENIHFELEIPDMLKTKYIAPMTIQMLIENAIKHNIISRKQPLTIRIFIDDFGRLVVSNNLQPKLFKEYSSGIGLKNIRSRYAFFTKEEIIIVETLDRFSVKVPLLNEPTGFYAEQPEEMIEE